MKLIKGEIYRDKYDFIYVFIGYKKGDRINQFCDGYGNILEYSPFFSQLKFRKVPTTVIKKLLSERVRQSIIDTYRKKVYQELEESIKDI